MSAEFPARPEPAARPARPRHEFGLREPARTPGAWKSLQTPAGTPTETMTRPIPIAVRCARRLLVAGLGVAFVASAPGCRMFERIDGEKDGGSGNRHRDDVAATRDPLLGGRLIPKQDIPIPGKSDMAGSKDPLLRGGSASRDRKEPFRLGPEDTAAALAGKPRDDVPRLDERSAPANAGRGPVAFGKKGGEGPIVASVPSLDAQLDDLRRLGAKFASPTKDANGEYVFSAELTQTLDGPTRRYEGAGPTPGEAVRQVLDQVRTDSGK